MTKYQEYYWKDPEHYQDLQREKYKRYPDRIKARNKVWQEKNKEYFTNLVRFAGRLYYERTHQNRPEKIREIIAMKNEYKSRFKRA